MLINFSTKDADAIGQLPAADLTDPTYCQLLDQALVHNKNESQGWRQTTRGAV